MMKSIVNVVAVGAMAFSLGGCAMASGGNGAVFGTIYSGYKMGGVVGPGTGTKTGQACASSILGAIAIGDASIASAKAAGGITQVAHVDHEIFEILGLYATSCTTVVGQ
jgi:hypothetical protein